jgi:predicted glycoside hydrolase/deacetylase ChbG (UPF0249 family)
MTTTTRYVIINADDFGASVGISRGIVQAHLRGIVTSASLMVTGRAMREAVYMSRDCPDLGVGLHWDVTGEGEGGFDLSNATAVRDELRRQLDAFANLAGHLPTHLDSHHHVHRRDDVMQVVREVVGPDLPVRGDGRASFVGGFYGQWEWGVSESYYTSPDFLIYLLQDETRPGWTELSCHPGFVTGDYQSVYLAEREAELRTLTDPRVREAIDRLQIKLANYKDLSPAATGQGRAA